MKHLISFLLGGALAVSAAADAVSLLSLVDDDANANPIEKHPVAPAKPKPAVKPKAARPAVTNAVPAVKPKAAEPAVTNVVPAVKPKAAPAKPKPKKALTGRPAKIRSATTYYDRKHGYVIFDRRVHVDDEQYQLHADKAFVFLGATNDLRRLVAIGHVAMTNETRRAYGAKVSYYRQDGMVVLYGGDGIAAEVRDEAKAEDQSVRGSKIKFWLDTEQVEVENADITAPAFGSEGVKDVLPGAMK